MGITEGMNLDYSWELYFAAVREAKIVDEEQLCYCFYIHTESAEQQSSNWRILFLDISQLLQCSL